MASPDYDLGYLETAVELLEGYLLSKEIYWKMIASSPPGEPSYPSLTLGGLLLAQTRIESHQLSPSQEGRKLRLRNEIERVRTKWRTAWENKAREEFRSRLDLWQNFVEEFRNDPDGNYDRYNYEVSRRVMLHLLAQEAPEIPITQQQLLAGLDRILEGLLVPAGFIWDQELAAGFSPDIYPHLYLIPKQ